MTTLVSTCFQPNIHQNGLEILGVKYNGVICDPLDG
jgi:hypothetical protein